MKTKSSILAIAASILGVALVIPDASALPPSKTSGARHVHKQQAASMKGCSTAMTDCSSTMKECCAMGAKKSIGLAVNKGATVR
ncbi:MAG: hypothetical protein KDN22_10535, partial [Verrucomicrobiae bacterium]|nr:hypothetical protein [Verrucomicrobiae bacterium]